MTLWHDTGNGEGWFALKMSNGEVYMVNFYAMSLYSGTQSSLSRRDIQTAGILFEEWVMKS